MRLNVLVDYCRHHVVVIFIATIVVGMAFHALTLNYSPVHWSDEVMINEGARGGVVSKDADWSMVWFPDESINQKSWLINYFGSWVLESGYQMFGHLGPRILTMTWLVLLTVLVAVYFHRKLVGWGLPCLLGLITFSFPGMVQSARGARVDAIAIAFIFAALVSVQSAERSVGRQVCDFVLCGIFSALAFFTWQPAAMLYPLILWEVGEQLFIQQKTDVRKALIFLAVAAFAFVLTVFLLMYPFWGDFWRRLFGASRTVGAMAETSKEMGWHWREYASAVCGIPGAYLLGFVALFLRRRLWPLAIVLLGLSLLCIATKVYVFRMLYLLPYALVGMGVLTATVRQGFGRILMRGVLVVMFGIAFVWSVVIRNSTEYFTRDFRNYDLLQQALEREVGRDVAIYQSAYQAYYIGRELGWKQYRVHCDGDVRVATNLLGKLDCALFEEKWTTPKLFELMQGAGFTTNYLVRVGNRRPANSIERFLESHNRLYEYGPFRLFRRWPIGTALK